jgi:hypothetical protein
VPVPKRYIKVSQDLNRDPEIWTLTDLFGDRALRTWLEILVQLDRNGNDWKLADGWAAVLARTTRQTVTKVRRIFGHAVAAGWLQSGGTAADGWPTRVSAPNWLKYNRSQEQKGNGADPLLSLPSPSPSPSVPLKKEKSVVPARRAQQLDALETFSISEDLKAWAQAEHRVVIPEHALVEFKDYWREQKRLRTNWGATFQNRVCALIRAGVITPKPLDPRETARKCKSANGEPCDEAPILGSSYCKRHKAFYAGIRARMTDESGKARA